ncbi:parasitophorous vacuolar protein 1, putative [Plasmodium gallinaceum]|uniref:Parasitophorous vacuolar protein 1, putative n=1 Tax=Plasmodium gallinaceum TaxID=5849 RepID=A0A1J1GV26_PLAGA|nr:parasitophorous vacuolar protein 1, putative [Plasmodium gallinaceum]CRG96341.1 parasitophorous vacuolar protein 1, putative [Plasmodium gallinaceum]
MIKAVLTLLFISYSYAVNVVDSQAKEQIKFSAKLELENPNHVPFLEIINSEFSKVKDFSPDLVKNGYTCSFNKFDIIIHNSSEAINKLFVVGNENYVRWAADEYKLRLMLTLDHLSSTTSLKNLEYNSQNVTSRYFSDLRRYFFELNNENSSDEGEPNDISDEEEVNQVASNYDSNEESKEVNSDLSEVENKEESGETLNNSLQKVSYTYQSSQIVSYNNMNMSNQTEGFSIDEPLTKQNALNILILNSTFSVEGECIKGEEKKENDLCIRFRSKLGTNILSTLCESSGKNFLRKFNGGNNNILLNNESLNEMMGGMYKLIESIFGNDKMFSPFLKDLNVLSNSGQLGFNMDEIVGQALNGNLGDEESETVNEENSSSNNDGNDENTEVQN